MSPRSVIQLTFVSTIPGRGSWERGFETKTYIRFNDQCGWFSALNKRIREAKERTSYAATTAWSSNGYRRRLWFSLQRYRETQEWRLMKKARKRTLRLLNGNTEPLGLTVAYNTDAPEAFHENVEPYKVDEIRDSLAVSERFWFTPHIPV